MCRSDWILLTTLYLLATARAAASLARDPEQIDSYSLPSRAEWKFSSTGVPESSEMSGAIRTRTRAIVKKVFSKEQAEGVGARVRRSVGGAEVMTYHNTRRARHSMLCILLTFPLYDS